jgi:hypothetical protein
MHRCSRLATSLLSTLAIVSSLACLGETSARASDGELVKHVAVLELGSDGVHDGLARKLGDALRRELAATAGYRVSDARVSLEQLSLVQDCDPEQEGCLARIAKQLGVGVLIHGTLSNEGSGALAKLSLFEHASQSAQHSAQTMFAQREVSDEDVARRATALLDELLGRPGSAPAPVPPVPAGVAGDTNLPNPEPVAAESSGLSTRRVAGYALLGGAGVSVGLAVLAFIEIDRAQGNENFQQYRLAVGANRPMTEDVCDEAEANKPYGLDSRRFEEVKSECSAGRTFEVLQFVFLGAAAVTGGLSAYFLLGEEDSSSGERKRISAIDFPVQPVVRRHSAELRARLKF